jgi:hypothetical protein
MTSIKEECRELILDISIDGHEFLTDDLLMYESVRSKERLDIIKNKLLYIKDELQFATIFKQLILAIMIIFKDSFEKRGYDSIKITNEISRDFISRHKTLIEQLWYWIAWLNIWHMIKFIVNVILAITKSHKTIV